MSKRYGNENFNEEKDLSHDMNAPTPEAPVEAAPVEENKPEPKKEAAKPAYHGPVRN